MADNMYSIMVAINVKTEHRESFIKASLAEIRGVIENEPGVFQFQMLEDENNPNRFYFFEIFKDEDAAKKHWDTDVFKTWWKAVEPMFDGDLEQISTMRTIFPSVSGLMKQKAGLLNC